MSGAGQLVMNGPLILAVPVAAVAGAITFASPCCLPLIPGYLSYVAGMCGAGAAAPAAAARDPDSGPATGTTAAALPRGRAVAGTALFVAGFSALFASYGAAFGGLGAALLTHQKVLIQVFGGLTITIRVRLMLSQRRSVYPATGRACPWCPAGLCPRSPSCAAVIGCAFLSPGRRPGNGSTFSFRESDSIAL
jgi:cytochrome c-type biogenesis protein